MSESRPPRLTRVPDPEVWDGPKRRTFTTEYKLRILRELDAVGEPDKTGEVVCRNRLYLPHIFDWCRKREADELQGSAVRKPSRPRRPHNPQESKVAQLEREFALECEDLPKARIFIDVQKSLGNAGDPSKREPRNEGLSTVEALGCEVGFIAAASAQEVLRATLYRRRKLALETTSVARTSHRALTAKERLRVLDVLNAERFADKAPADIYATLLDERARYGSISTM